MHNRRGSGWLGVVLVVAMAISGCGALGDNGSDQPGDQPDTADEALVAGGPPPQHVPVPDGFARVHVEFTEMARLNEPIGFATRPGDDAIYVAERSGQVRRLEILVDSEGESTVLGHEAVINIDDIVSTTGEGGLLAIAFSPDGSYLYLSYTDQDFVSRITAYAMQGNMADRTTRIEIIAVEQPFENHNGGDIRFGPDGYLYWGLGDGGGSGDPKSTGQDPTDLLGSILRIIPNPPKTGYQTPPDNPFSPDGDNTGAAEVWAYGLRNPWRFSFDPANADLWVADVGQNNEEEINHLPASDGSGRGANLGWNAMEGASPYSGPEPADHVAPIVSYAHDQRCSVTGGEVYRGDRIPGLAGTYLYGDWCTGEIHALHNAGNGNSSSIGLGSVGSNNLVSFGVGPNKEIWVASIGDGIVYRMDPAP